MSAAPNRAARRASARPSSNGHKKFLSMRDFEHDKVIPIEIAGWGTVMYELPDLSAELALGRVPNELRAALTAALTRDDESEPLAPDEARDYFLMQCNIIARHLREPDVLGRFGGDEAAAQEWVLKELDPGIRMQLWGASLLHNASPSAFADTFRAGRAGSRRAENGGPTGEKTE